MRFVQLEDEGIVYEAEYFSDEHSVTIFSESGEIVLVDIDDMSTLQAARVALRNLIQMDLASPKSPG